jgi:hypothetical protein
MIKFRSFINEAWLDATTGTKKQRGFWLTKPGEAKMNKSRTSQLGETHDHTIHKIDKGTDPDGTNNVVYYAKKKGSQRIDATINGTEKDHAVHIDSMATHPDGEMRMHHLIHHLVAQHGKSVGSSHYSPGGKKVMERVGEMEGTEISHWKDHNKVHPADAYADNEDTPEHDKTYVVAHPAVQHHTKTAEFHRGGLHKLNEDEDQHARIHGKVLSSGEHVRNAQKYINGSYSLNNHCHALHDGYGISGGGMKQSALKDHAMNRRMHETDSVFNDRRNHVGEEVHVHTGLSESPHIVVKKEEKRIGQKPKRVRLHLPAYTSTSTDENVAKDFAPQDNKGVEHILHIRVKHDHPAVSMVKAAEESKDSHIKKCASEKEITLHRGTNLHLNPTPEVEHDAASGRTFHHWFATTDGVSHHAA